MPPILTRRTVLVGAALFSPVLFGMPGVARSQEDDDIDNRLKALEQKTGGRLGVSVLDTATNISLDYRETERFPLLSSFKALASACILARIDQNEDALARRILFSKDDLVDYSPVTEKFAGAKGMTIAALCEAAITLSDNTAGNLLLQQIGGPEGLTAWLRSIGDSVTRLDRIEPHLNEALKGDARDTTTPQQMRDTLNLLLGRDSTALSVSARQQLLDWLAASKTGDARLRAGLPKDKDIIIGEKTGTNSAGAACDAGLIWPAGKSPLFVSVYIAEANLPAKELNPVFAEVGRMIAELL
ncbi:class A beta-lactamase [Pararhizobium sp.]|uniref:class A beta-lactamase n=1 Tax=Pararhizobium sp. TaxID=1977563 RepID=UPI0027166E8F|nr:class A beta-lactamase [Pararhizobium sp.]MDO9417274.1 class A beta-lactamase [Pararhizobium sp.]